MSRFARFARTHVHLHGQDVSSQRIRELLGLINGDNKQRFFKLQSARRLETGYRAYDTTSVSSYSEMLKKVKYGWNKEQDPLPQIHLAILAAQSSRRPVYYRAARKHYGC